MNDGKPIQPPSKVLCNECLAALSAKFYELHKAFLRADAGAGKERGGG